MTLIDYYKEIESTGTISRSLASMINDVSNEEFFAIIPEGSFTKLPSKVNVEPTLEWLNFKVHVSTVLYTGDIVERIDIIKEYIEYLKDIFTEDAKLPTLEDTIPIDGVEMVIDFRKEDLTKAIHYIVREAKCDSVYNKAIVLEKQIEEYGKPSILLDFQKDKITLEEIYNFFMNKENIEIYEEVMNVLGGTYDQGKVTVNNRQYRLYMLTENPGMKTLLELLKIIFKTGIVC